MVTRTSSMAQFEAISVDLDPRTAVRLHRVCGCASDRRRGTRHHASALGSRSAWIRPPIFETFYFSKDAMQGTLNHPSSCPPLRPPTVTGLTTALAPPWNRLGDPLRLSRDPLPLSPNALHDRTCCDSVLVPRPLQPCLTRLQLLQCLGMLHQ